MKHLWIWVTCFAMAMTGCASADGDVVSPVTAVTTGQNGTGRAVGDGAASGSAAAATSPPAEADGGSTTTVVGVEALDPAVERDIQRRNDIEAVFDALRSYFSDQQAAGAEELSYPSGPYSALAAVLVPTYLSALPADPSRPGNYTYVVADDGYTFALGTWFESSPGDRWFQAAGIAESGAMEPLLRTAMGSPPWGE